MPISAKTTDGPPDRPALSIAGVTARYGDSRVLHGVGLHVSPGEIVTILGRNGVGKTTLMRSIIGILRQREGSITVNGVETIGLPARKIARLGVAFVPEDRGIYASLSVEENLMLPPVLQPGGLSLPEVFELFPNLQSRLGSRGKALSGGEQQMLAIARVLRTGARLLLLDEPTEGLAPVIIDQIQATVERLKAGGYTILLVEQNLRFARRLSDRFYVMEGGRIVDETTSSEFDRSEARILRHITV